MEDCEEYNQICNEVAQKLSDRQLKDIVPEFADLIVMVKQLKRRNEELENIVFDLSQDETLELLYAKSRLLSVSDFIDLYNKFYTDLKELHSSMDKKESLYEKILKFTKNK